MINQYYNVPAPADKSSLPAYCAGAHYSDEKGLRIIIHRDLSMKLTSLTVAYRFSGGSVRVKDPEHPYMTRVYDKAQINEREYLVVGLKTPDSVPDGITAVISSVTLESGETVSYKIGFYLDTENPIAVEGKEDTESPALHEFFEYRRSHSSSLANRHAHTISSIAQKSAAVLLSEENGAYESGDGEYVSKKGRVSAYIVTAAVLLLTFVAGIIAVIVHFNTKDIAEGNTVSSLMESGEYATAYKLAVSLDDYEAAEEVARKAFSVYIANGDYESAFLFASIAPEPFDAKVVDDYVRRLISRDKCEEAYDFVSKLPRYKDSLLRVSVALVDRAIEERDYKAAFTYAAKAPEALEDYVMQEIAENVVRDGQINREVFEALKSLGDYESFDEMAKKASDSFVKDKKYLEAAAIVAQISNDGEKNDILKSLCEVGIKEYIENGETAKAGELYSFTSPYLPQDFKAECVKTALKLSSAKGDRAGVIYFTKQTGGETSMISIDREDETVRAQLSLVWELLTEEQRRAYHSREMDIYKEAFRIVDGKLGDIENAVSVAVSEKIVAVLKTDGTAETVNINGHYSTVKLPEEKGFIQIDAGRDHVLLLSNDGRVVASGSNNSGQCNTSEWKNVVKVAAGADFSAALRSDGSLYACGSNLSGQCNVAEITGVMDIAATDRTLVLLMRNGTVRLVGDISMGMRDALKFENVKRIRAGGSTVIAEIRGGGYLMANGTQKADLGSTSAWSNVRDFAAGSVCIGCIYQNGSMITEGEGAPIIHEGYDPDGE